MSSVRDIARHAGVSAATVSRVLNNRPDVSAELRDRVVSVVNRERYVQSVGRKSTNNVGFVFTGPASLGSSFDAALLQGMSDALEAHGHDLLILNARRSRRQNESYSQMFMRKGVRGVVVRTTAATRDVCVQIADEGFPAVVVADVFDEPQVHYVAADSVAASRQAIDHLADAGHRRIAVALNVVDDHDHRDRLEAYRATLAARGLAYDDRLVLRVPATLEGGAGALRQIMANGDRATAVYVCDPASAVGLFHEAQRTGVSIPGDLSVVGFDDGDARFGVYPRMSAVCQDAEALGREAMAALERLMLKPRKKAVERRTLACWMELLDSTGPLATESTRATTRPPIGGKPKEIGSW